MKKILILAMMLLLIGCDSDLGNNYNDLDFENTYSYNTTCIDGVLYFYAFNSGRATSIDVTSPKFNADGTISTCLDENHQ